jgi:hypothetical protein
MIIQQPDACSVDFPEMTQQQVCEFLAFAAMCRMLTECIPYQPTTASAKATRAAIRRQVLPIPGRSANR